jgi:hypothetical protein
MKHSVEITVRVMFKVEKKVIKAPRITRVEAR